MEQKLRLTLRPLAVAVLSSAFLVAGCRTESVTSGSATISAAAQKPAGLGRELDVAVPAPKYPVLAAYKNQTGKTVDGISVNKYDPKYNPVIGLLSGFDGVWTVGDQAWASGGANGDGPKDFSKAKTVTERVWKENIAYCVKVTGKERTPERALRAYLDDRRDQQFSVIDGLGPLADAYIEGSGATTTVSHKAGDQDFDPNKKTDLYEEDKGSGAGTTSSKLGKFVAFMQIIRGPEGTTSPAKYFYSSPRPWRMNDNGEVKQTGTETLGGKTYEVYETNVSLLPALATARETRGRQKDGAFPSGHTNAAYLSAIAYAYAIPERFAEMLTRASDLADDRIVAGMHSPVDIVGGRIMATAIAAAYLNDPANTNAKKAAFENTHEYFGSLVPEGQTLASWARAATAGDRFADNAANKKMYRDHMTSGFSQDKKAGGKAMVVPAGAEVLLETRLPYLTAPQRRAVLYTTGLDSGYAIIDESDGWGRLDLVKAASGYGAFAGDVRVDMDANLDGFCAADEWSNDISGPGKLEKTGSGTLALSGNNSWTGGTIVGGGKLAAKSATALGKSAVYVESGTLAIDAPSAVRIVGNYTQVGGATEMTVRAANKAALEIAKTMRVDAGDLRIHFDGIQPKEGDVIRLVSAKDFVGSFGNILADGYSVTPVYSAGGISVRIDSVK